MTRLLVVEDDPAIVEPLVRALERDGYAVEVASTALSALARVENTRFDGVLLDLNLPDGDGLDVCRDIRVHRPRLPILILTARAEEIDTVVGLDSGADDYVTKPFRVAELLARVRALVRRSTPDKLTVADLEIDVGAHLVRRAGVEVNLTPTEFDLLSLLALNAGQLITRDRIMDEVFDQRWAGSTKTLDVHMSSLRRKLGDDPDAAGLIATVRGVGFRLDDPSS